MEAIHIPDTTDNPHWAYNQAFAEDNLQRVHNLEQAMDSCALEVSNPEADIQGKVDTQVEIEALPRDARPESRTHVHDRSFGDQHVYLARLRWQDGQASQWEYQPPLVF